jgi:hypothetical protein
MRAVLSRQSVRPLVGGAGVIGGVNSLAQGAIIGEGQDRLHRAFGVASQPSCCLSWAAWASMGVTTRQPASSEVSTGE